MANGTSISPSARGAFTEDLGAWSPEPSRRDGRKFRVASLDCGAKRNSYRNLVDRGCEIVTLPHDATAADRLVTVTGTATYTGSPLFGLLRIANIPFSYSHQERFIGW